MIHFWSTWIPRGYSISINENDVFWWRLVIIQIQKYQDVVRYFWQIFISISEWNDRVKEICIQDISYLKVLHLNSKSNCEIHLKSRVSFQREPLSFILSSRSCRSSIIVTSSILSKMRRQYHINRLFPDKIQHFLTNTRVDRKLSLSLFRASRLHHVIKGFILFTFQWLPFLRSWRKSDDRDFSMKTREIHHESLTIIFDRARNDSHEDNVWEWHQSIWKYVVIPIMKNLKNHQ